MKMSSRGACTACCGTKSILVMATCRALCSIASRAPRERSSSSGVRASAMPTLGSTSTTQVGKRTMPQCCASLMPPDSRWQKPLRRSFSRRSACASGSESHGSASATMPGAWSPSMMGMTSCSRTVTVRRPPIKSPGVLHGAGTFCWGIAGGIWRRRNDRHRAVQAHDVGFAPGAGLSHREGRPRLGPYRLFCTRKQL